MFFKENIGQSGGSFKLLFNPNNQHYSYRIILHIVMYSYKMRGKPTAEQLGGFLWSVSLYVLCFGLWGRIAHSGICTRYGMREVCISLLVTYF